MLTLFAIPDSATTISATASQVTAYVAEYLPVIYLGLAMVVVLGTIAFVSRKLKSAPKRLLGRRT